MIDPTSLVPSMQDAPLQPFDEFSRYRACTLLTRVDASGTQVVYVSRRFLPRPETMAEVAAVVVRDGDRLDIVAAQQFGDARWWWRLADANRALDPADLVTRIGWRLRITLPAGMPAPR